ncbi:MAG: DNA polymerase III subunit beta [bacterium]
MSLSDGRVLIECDQNSYELQTMPAEDFPEPPDIEPLATIEFKQNDLRRLLNQVLFAVPARDPRKVLLGALFDLRENELRAVATDGKKLGLSSLVVEESRGESKIQAIIPQKVLSELEKNLGPEGSVTVQLGEKRVGFELGKITYVASRIEGTFPNYELVIPKQLDHEVRINKEKFSAGIRRAAILSEARNNSIVLKFSEGRLNIGASTADLGTFKGAIPAEFSGDEINLAFNHRYLTDVLKVIGTDDLLIRINTPSSPVIFVETGETRALFLIMPIKITDLSDLGSGPEDEEEGDSENAESQQ